MAGGLGWGERELYLKCGVRDGEVKGKGGLEVTLEETIKQVSRTNIIKPAYTFLLFVFLLLGQTIVGEFSPLPSSQQMISIFHIHWIIG